MRFVFFAFAEQSFVAGRAKFCIGQRDRLRLAAGIRISRCA